MHGHMNAFSDQPRVVIGQCLIVGLAGQRRYPFVIAGEPDRVDKLDDEKQGAMQAQKRSRAVGVDFLRIVQNVHFVFVPTMGYFSM